MNIGVKGLYKLCGYISRPTSSVTLTRATFPYQVKAFVRWSLYVGQSFRQLRCHLPLHKEGFAVAKHDRENTVYIRPTLVGWEKKRFLIFLILF